MRFGVFHVSPSSGADPAAVAKHAEDLGFESYWVADHTIIPMKYSVAYPAGPDGSEPDYLWQIPDPLIALTRASATTRRIRLGTGICLVAERHPILLAKQVATLDDLSGGRVLFGNRRRLESRRMLDPRRRLRPSMESGERLHRGDEGALDRTCFGVSRKIREFSGGALLPEARAEAASSGSPR